jgi:hypothetical protein
VVVGFDLDEDGGSCGSLEGVGSGEDGSIFRVGSEESDLGGSGVEDGSVVGVGRDSAGGVDDLLGVTDHLEERHVLLDAVDRPSSVEDLVPAVLGVDLGEHKELDVCRVSGRVEGKVALEEVVELRGGEGETEGDVCLDEQIHRGGFWVELVLVRDGERGFGREDGDVFKGAGGGAGEDLGRGGRSDKEGLGHTIVDELGS